MSSQLILTVSAVALALLVLMGVGSTEAFEYSGYCAKMCAFGRGGNLCKCSAVHFAGKRTGGGAGGSDYIDDLEGLLANDNSADDMLAGENELSNGAKWSDSDRLGLEGRIEALLVQHPTLLDSFKHLLKSSRKRRTVNMNNIPTQ